MDNEADTLRGVAPRGKSGRSDAFETRKLQILREAAHAFVEKGFHQTSVDDLAARLQVTKPVLYYYVKNKDDLLSQCGQIAFAQLNAAMERARAARLSGLGKLRSFFSAYAEIMCGDFGRCLALVDVKAMGVATREADVMARRTLEMDVREMVVEGQGDGSIRDCDPAIAGRALFGAFNGIPRWFDPASTMRASDVADLYLDLFIEGLRRR